MKIAKTRRVERVARTSKSVLRHVTPDNSTTPQPTKELITDVVTTDPVTIPNPTSTSSPPVEIGKTISNLALPVSSEVAQSEAVEKAASTVQPSNDTLQQVVKKTPTSKGVDVSTAEPSALRKLGNNLKDIALSKIYESGAMKTIEQLHSIKDTLLDMLKSDEDRAHDELVEKERAAKEAKAERIKEHKFQFDALEKAFNAGKISRKTYLEGTSKLEGLSEQDTTKIKDVELAETTERLRNAKIEKIDSSATTLSTLERNLNAGNITADEFQHHSKDLFKSHGVKQSENVDSISSSIDELRNAIEKARSTVLSDNTLPEVKAKPTDEKREIVKELGQIDEHLTETKKGGTSTLSEKLDVVKEKAAKATEKYSSAKDAVKSKAKGLVEKLKDRVPTSLLGDTAGGAVPSIAAAGASGLLGTLGTSVSALGAGTVALGSAAAGALGAGVGTMLYNGSDTVRNVAGNAVEGLFGHITTGDELEAAREKDPRYQQAIAAAKAKRAKVEAEQTATKVAHTPTIFDKQNAMLKAVDEHGNVIESATPQLEANKHTYQPINSIEEKESATPQLEANKQVELIARKKNVADLTDNAIQQSREVATSKKESVAVRNITSTPVIVNSQGQAQRSTIVSSPQPRSQENTLQRLAERMFRGAVV